MDMRSPSTVWGAGVLRVAKNGGSSTKQAQSVLWVRSLRQKGAVHYSHSMVAGGLEEMS